mmetsp:Transcript_11326/g.26846  ORF Transcript_11326/g.26846 Transcript_11326/m.26846 type:complete len:286 (+) Transcript_11326:2613-3470(+)
MSPSDGPEAADASSPATPLSSALPPRDPETPAGPVNALKGTSAASAPSLDASSGTPSGPEEPAAAARSSSGPMPLSASASELTSLLPSLLPSPQPLAPDGGAIPSASASAPSRPSAPHEHASAPAFGFKAAPRLARAGSAAVAPGWRLSGGSDTLLKPLPGCPAPDSRSPPSSSAAGPQGSTAASGSPLPGESLAPSAPAAMLPSRVPSSCEGGEAPCSPWLAPAPFSEPAVRAAHGSSPPFGVQRAASFSSLPRSPTVLCRERSSHCSPVALMETSSSCSRKRA